MDQLILFIRLFDLGQPVASEIGPKAMRLDLRSSSGRPISNLNGYEFGSGPSDSTGSNSNTDIFKMEGRLFF